MAKVSVRVEACAHDEVVVSDEVFAWRRDVHGPQAVSGGPGDQELVAEAVAGVRYVLVRSGHHTGRSVTLIRILDTPVDTGPGDMKFAAAMAACQALEVKLENPPFIDASGAVFP
ncbi:hypothetical protein Aph02nite_92190 [Actinoplanes philippinensis]|uniref:Uncharacterized protein n=1 Tax=Actinoplanes philippinensis TaxID=35752 RepID=A0A1I2MSG0_9ACTN|nr:hypothetical protein Aph02nite_92190 [Actinoplanes philippinensis]SFF94515.1 hypothetical protein SAMN05421541_13343 [Actinoplanes philippinensis]